MISDKISVVLVDDHDLVRRSVKRSLARDHKIVVVGEADDSLGAIELIARIHPDVAIIDIRLRQGTGIEVSKAINSMSLRTRILVLSAYDNSQYIRALIKTGVSGYLLKDVSDKELKSAIHDVAQDRVFFSTPIVEKMVGLIRTNVTGLDTVASYYRLTGRQTDVLGLMMHGMKNQVIADKLDISRKTVEVHVDQIFQKLDVSSRAQAIIKATSSELEDFEIDD